MFEISPAVRIDAPPEAVWAVLVDVEAWWVPSNPDHDAIEILSEDDALGEGTPAAGCTRRSPAAPASRRGRPRRSSRGSASRGRRRARGTASWGSPSRSTRASPGPSRRSTAGRATVWARFPDSVVGTVAEWVFVHVLDGVGRDREHAIQEHRYIERQVES